MIPRVFDIHCESYDSNTFSTFYQNIYNDKTVIFVLFAIVLIFIIYCSSFIIRIERVSDFKGWGGKQRR